MQIAQAYFAGGCFWCITPVFREQNGVLSVVSGFSGGEEAFPRYEDVKHGKTHHRETIRITYRPDVISYDELVQLFLWNVDPFDGGGQFIDRGRSYSLAIYYETESERNIADRLIDALSKESGLQPQIAVEPFRSFYPADESHQDFDRKNPSRYFAELEESGRNRFFSEKMRS